MAAKDFQLVRLKKGKHNFEVMVNPGTVPKFRKGELPFDRVLYADMIFKNQSKGDHAAEGDLTLAFETSDIKECAKIICMKGDLQLTAAERQEKVDKKKREIVNFIHKYYIDPKSNLPHPVIRIESAITDIKYHVDPDTPVDKQVAEIVKKLIGSGTLSLRKSEMEGKLTIYHEHMGSCQGAIIGRFVTVRKETWTDKGCEMDVTLVPGDYDACLKELERLTKGNYVFDVANSHVEEPLATQGARKQGGKKKGGGGKGKKGK